MADVAAIAVSAFTAWDAEVAVVATMDESALTACDALIEVSA